MKNLILCFATFLAFASCKNEPASTEDAAVTADTFQTTTPAPPNSSAAPGTAGKAEGKVVSLQGNLIKLDNNTEIALPGSGDKATVIFFVRPSESIPGKTSLSADGQARTGALALLFNNVGLARAFASDNASLQTALMPARANGSELDIYKPENEKFLSETLKNYKGSRLLVVGTPATLTGFLSKLGSLEPVSETEFDNIYLAILKDGEATQIKHFKY